MNEDLAACLGEPAVESGSVRRPRRPCSVLGNVGGHHHHLGVDVDMFSGCGIVMIIVSFFGNAMNINVDIAADFCFLNGWLTVLGASCLKDIVWMAL